jgi:tetratricopeptide (TPR) repeat protein
MEEGLGPQKSKPEQRMQEGTQVECRRLCLEAMAALNQGAVGQSQKLVDKAVALADESLLAGESRSKLRVATLRYAAAIYEASGALGESLNYIEKAVTVAAAGVPEAQHALYGLNVECAALLSAMGRENEADARWRSVIFRIADTLGDPILQADTRLQYAAFLRRCGRHQDASREMIGAFGQLPLIERSEGARVAQVLMGHADNLGTEGAFTEAALLSGEALRRLQECAPSSENRSFGDFLDDVRWQHADFSVKAGKIGEGRQVYELLLTAWGRDLDPADSQLMQLRDDISKTEAEVGNFARALEFAEENVRLARDEGGETYQRNATARVASIFRMQGRYRDAYEMVKPIDNNQDEFASEMHDEELFHEDAEQESLENQLRAAESLPMPHRIVRRANILAKAAVDVVEDDPEQALERIAMAQDELDALAPGQTMHLTRALGDLRARAVANLGGLPKQIEFEERRLADFVKAHGCSAEMTRQFLVRDLADLHIQNENYQSAEELLREIRGFLELRGGEETLLYGTTLITLAGITDDVREKEQLRAQGMEIVDSLRDQTDFD